MKLSERFREEFQTHVQSGPVGEFELINNQNIEACAEWVEAVEKRLLTIISEASHEIAMAPVPIETGPGYKAQRPSDGPRMRLYEKALFDVLRKVGDVARGEV